MDFSNYIFRAHMVGKIISVPKPLTKNQMDTLKDYDERANGIGDPLTKKQMDLWHELKTKENNSKKYKLTEGQKKTLRGLVYKQKYGYKEYINSDAIEKGLFVEKGARDLISEVLVLNFVACKERRQNEWVTGKMDIEPDGVVIDIKSASTKSSFCNILDEAYKENELYLRQADCYMELWGLKDSIICHVLMDSPLDIIDRQIKQILYRPRLFNQINNEITDDGMDVIKGIISNHIITEKAFDDFIDNYKLDYAFDDYIEFSKDQFPEWKPVPKKERIHMIPHKFQKERIEQRNECIKIAREYMNTVKPVNNLMFDV